MNNQIQNCIDIIDYLSNYHKLIAQFSFNTFHSYNLLQERIDLEGELKPVFEKALKIRAQTHLPFWDSFNVSVFDTDLKDFDFLNEIKFHNTPKFTYIIQKEAVKDFLLEQKEQDYLTICSKVILSDGSINHIPLLDFHIPVNEKNEIICEAVIRTLGLKGFLLNSGKSYHFYGMNLIEETSLIDMLSHSLLFAPIIDRSWIAHQLIEKKCSLRISKKYSRLPFKIRDI